MAAGERPQALIAVFSSRPAVLRRILGEIAAGPSPPIADWFVGTYGINKAIAQEVSGVEGCRYAPVFAIQPQTSMQARLRRRLPAEEAARVEDAAHAGEIPGTAADQVLPSAARRVWGIELGRRHRDAIRAARKKGLPVEAWQFDEVLGECRNSKSHREFVGGVLRGMAQGRPILGDRPERGFVWTARTAVTGLPGLALSGDLPLFFEDLELATRFLVGEEYPDFTGNPATRAAQFADGHRALAARTDIRRKIGNRYLVGLTPGFRPSSTGLGGNVEERSLAEVSSWRNGYIEARIAAKRPRGFAQYNFVIENARPNRLIDAVRSLHHAATLTAAQAIA
jgi:hypothetical protein